MKVTLFIETESTRHIIFQMPLAFRYYDTARVLAVALSRKFRLEKDISSQLPKVAVISPSSGGIPVAFGVRDALNAEQVY